MEILFYRYGSICEPDVISCFSHYGLDVITVDVEIKNKTITPSQTVQIVDQLCREHTFLFVFSINFFPSISDYCEIRHLPYVSWTVDSPIMELFSPSLSNSCNRTFMFDRAQYEYFRSRGPEHIFHLPLATNVARWDQVINTASPSQKAAFSSDISFIGSLYQEKNPYAKIKGISEYTKGYTEGIMEAQLGVYGCNFIEELLTPEIMEDYIQQVPDLTKSVYANTLSPSYVMANHFIGMDIAVKERQRVLSRLSEQHDVALYTFSDTSALPNVHVKGGAKTLTEMPLVFHESKINLNITIRPIQTGLSLRVFDILGCGGFLLTNYQAELPEYYEIGTDLETFSSMEELDEKAAFYLKHEEQRRQIAQNGYEKTKAMHTYEIRVAQMIKILNDTL
ncbi:MAG TPA: DUF3880 domain-containing protein [Lachnospiraceae bacterium]|nr:DUF3880 domain-containing protein [Lachnospiraceae bacterium]HPF29274.1 DUF3880 domain-containing protein [Lachnospiraceae bacterium]